MFNTNIEDNMKSPVICIGGANVDKKLYAKDKLVHKTSNPVSSSRTVGGVARNIAENLGRLGEEVILLSVSGNDPDWMEVSRLSSSFMNLNYVARLENASTGAYTAVLDDKGDLSIALADMDIFEHITPEFLMKHSDVLIHAKCIVVDLNCPGETVEFLCSYTSKHHIPLVIIPVSSPKMNRLPKELSGVDWLIVNKSESETFLNFKMNDKDDWDTAVRKWMETGVKNVIITNGSKGVVAGMGSQEIRGYPAIETDAVVDVTGAGDSFCAGVIYSWLQKEESDSIIKSGLVNAHKTIISKNTVRHDLSQKQFALDMEEFK